MSNRDTRALCGSHWRLCSLSPRGLAFHPHPLAFSTFPHHRHSPAKGIFLYQSPNSHSMPCGTTRPHGGRSFLKPREARKLPTGSPTSRDCLTSNSSLSKGDSAKSLIFGKKEVHDTEVKLRIYGLLESSHISRQIFLKTSYYGVSNRVRGL